MTFNVLALSYLSGPWMSLMHEWTVTVVGPHDAGALIARECSVPRDDRDRIFDYVSTHHRATVTAAARPLLQHLAPGPPT